MRKVDVDVLNRIKRLEHGLPAAVAYECALRQAVFNFLT